MLISYKLDFSCCNIMSGFGKSSHIYENKQVVNNIELADPTILKIFLRSCKHPPNPQNFYL